MSTLLYTLNHGIPGITFTYLIMLVPILVGLAVGRAPSGKFLLAPLFAVPMMIVAGIITLMVSLLIRGSYLDDLMQFIVGVTVSIVVGLIAGRRLATPRGAPGLEHRRGAMVTTAPPPSARPDNLVSRRRSRKRSVHGGGITLAGVPIALEDETKHFKIIGTTGTGKSTAIREILAGALARGDRAIIADPDGGYARQFYDPARGDVILNPFLSDGRKWDLFGEVVNHYDIDQLARSLIPDSGDPDRIWSEYARTFFSAVMRQMIRTGNKDDRELLRLIRAAPDEELRTLLAGTAAAPFVKEGNEKMFGCLRAVASSAVKVLEYIVDQQAEPFSVRQWVRDGKAKHAGGQGSVLFIPYTAGEIAALRSVISAWMRLGIFQAMDREEGDQRLWFVIDELDALGEVDGLKDALARLRKFGGRCILGFQSISQVSGTYGKGVAETIVENCGNTYILRCSASEHGGTSEFASKLIGQREVLHTTQSTTRQSRWSWRTSITNSQQIKIEPAVMASEIERLPNLTGFLKLVSIPDWQVATLTLRSESTSASAWRPNVTTSPLSLPATPTTTASATAASPPTTSPLPTASTPPTTSPLPTASTPPTASPPAAPAPSAASRSTSSPVAAVSPASGARDKPRARKPRASTTRGPRQPRPAPQPAPDVTPVQNRPGGAESPHS